MQVNNCVTQTIRYSCVQKFKYCKLLEETANGKIKSVNEKFKGPL